MKNMLLFFLFSIIQVSFLADPPQTKFYVLDENSDQYAEWVNDSDYRLDLASVFREKNPQKIFMSTDALDSTDKYDFSKLDSLQTVSFLLGMMPDDPDSSKEAYWNRVKLSLNKISCFSKCRQLRRVIFVICNRIYLTGKQCKPQPGEKEFGNHYTERTVRMNLAAAWRSIGNLVLEKLPGIKIYAVAEEW